MGNYNFSALDDKEFEALVCDLVGALLGTRVERFKPGKDAGVDGRWFATNDNEGIVQCKHWMRSGFAALYKTMSEREKQKIDRLDPMRYILATSITLSRNNKKRLATALAPHIKCDSDILGLEDLEDLLERHPDIEKRHYKLWLSSASVLRHVFHNAVLGRSDFDAASMQTKFRLLVKTNTFDAAAELLANSRTVIITGAPGIGKTTLAEQLIVQHLVDGYELVSMRDITDGESVFSADARQIFYFDDFLGRNMLEALKLQHDSHIVSFIRRIEHDRLKRFVLTSRSSILNQGKCLSDLFGLAKTDRNEYELRIEHLSRWDKARILYSHVWHSTLSDRTLDEIFVQQRYKHIVNHPNYNPRLIAFITDNDKTGTLPASEYWKYVEHTLEDPKDLWRHFFEQLSQDCRDLTYLVVLNAGEIAEGDLRYAFRRIRSSLPSDIGKIAHDVAVGLRICTGSSLNRSIDARNDTATYDLYNPSIADYVLRDVEDWAVFAEYFAALRTVASLEYLEELRTAHFVSEAAYVHILDVIAHDCRGRPSGDAHALAVCCRLFEHETLCKAHREMLHTRLNNLPIRNFSGSDYTLLDAVIKALNRRLIDDPNAVIRDTCERLMEWPMGFDELPLLGELLAHREGSEADALLDKAKKCARDHWDEFIREYIDENDLLRGVYDASDFQQGYSELINEVEKRLGETGLGFAGSEVRSLCLSVSMHDISERNYEWDEEAYEAKERPSPPAVSEVEDGLIDDLFERDLPQA